MTTRGRPGRRAAGRRPRRKPVWIDTFVSGALANGAQLDIDLLTALGANDIPGLTLTRTIVDLSFLSASPGGSNGTQRVDVGIGIHQIEAAAANVFADPQSALDFPTRGWVFRKHTVVVDSVDSHDHEARTMEFDLASRRVLHTVDSGLNLIIDSLTFGGDAFTVDVQGWIRSLFLLP